MDSRIELEIPFPPSINHCFSYAHGRPVLTKQARTFRSHVRRIARATRLKPLLGPIAIRIEIHPPDDRRRDVDNAQKTILDALQHAGAFWDDSQVVWLLTVKGKPRAESKAIVQLCEHSADRDPFPTSSSTGDIHE